MKKIKEFFISLKIKKKRQVRQEKWKKPMVDFKSIHILANSSEERFAAEKIIKSNWGNEIEIRSIYFDEIERGSGTFSHHDFSIFGQPNQRLQEFISAKADLLLVPTLRLNLYGELILASKQPVYTIGFYQKRLSQYFDLMLTKEGEEVEPNLKHLLKYLKKIN